MAIPGRSAAARREALGARLDEGWTGRSRRYCCTVPFFIFQL